MFGPDIPPEEHVENVDHLDRISMALTAVKRSLPQLHLLEVTSYIMTNVRSLFYLDSHVPRDRLKEWLREEIRKDVHCAFKLST